MSSKFNPNINKLKNNRQVWVDDASFKNTSGIASLTLSEVSTIYDSFNKINKHRKTSKGFINVIKNDSKMFDLLNIFVNVNVRAGTESLSSDNFIKWLDERFENEINSMKSEKGKERKRTFKEEMMNKFKFSIKLLDGVFALREELRKAKMIILRKLESIESMETFIKTEDGFRVTKPEGFVGVDKLTNSAIKIVDRLEFSKANFSVPKDWIKG